MKRVVFIALISLGLSACIPPPTGGGNPSGNRIKAKLIRVTCASKVFQILDPAHYDMGETWTDTGTPPTTYEHIAKVGNPCDFPETIAVGSEFYFKVNNNPGTDCAVCMLWDAPPTTTINITVVP